ncbi:MAG: glycosyltransferase [Alphaproteobacteria bacterium]|nr:glycosyltransferase [Alphaproteobacteria bacterium]
MNKPLLTAIIFTYNHKNHIARCIESHLNQKTSYSYIIKIYDDCSSDGTTDICKEYAAKYPDKIQLTVQKENTFLKPYHEMQSYKAIQEIDSKYFCICDGDDCWCDENKIQIALDFLENHPDYHGFATDTYYEDIYTHARKSYIHDELKMDKVENPVTLSAQAPFLLVSARIFRTSDYSSLKLLPIDYLQYYYHLSKGPIYYYDKPTSVYSCGINNTYASLSMKFIKDNNAMMTYRLSKLFNFKKDKFCTDLLLSYDTKNDLGDKRYKFLCNLKNKFGVKFGWEIWFIINFIFKYGIEVANINYIYSRKKVKKHASPKYRRKKLKLEIQYCNEVMKSKYKGFKLLKFILQFESLLPKYSVTCCKHSMMRKRKRIHEYNKRRHEMMKYKI